MRAGATPHRRVVACMGTVFSFDVRAPGVELAALDEAIAWLHWVDATFSTYSPHSQLSRLARHECAVTDCAPEVAQVLAECARLAEVTAGHFTATPFGTLDPSGYVKGWAIERVSDMLRAAGSVNHCVNGGGDVQCVGLAAPGRPWGVGIANPLRQGSYAAVVVGTDAVGTDAVGTDLVERDVPDLAIATSGTAERGDHIAGPDGRPASGVFASITVVGRRLAKADAFATAAFAMGEQARGWLDSLPDYRAFVVGVDGRTWTTGRWGEATPRSDRPAA